MLEAPKDRKVLSMERACKTHPPRSQESDKDVSHQAQRMFFAVFNRRQCSHIVGPRAQLFRAPSRLHPPQLETGAFSGSRFRIDARSAGCAFQ